MDADEIADGWLDEFVRAYRLRLARVAMLGGAESAAYMLKQMYGYLSSMCPDVKEMHARSDQLEILKGSDDLMSAYVFVTMLDRQIVEDSMAS